MINYDKILASPYDETTSIKQQLQKLLKKVMKEQECFSGKRPFGDGCYYFEIYAALAKAGVTFIMLDEDGYVNDLDDKKTTNLIDELIDHIFRD